MPGLRKKSLCILLAVCLLLATSTAAFAGYAPTNRFTFIPIAYEGEILDALPCSDGMFAAKNENFKSGFIAADGTLQISFDYANAGAFSDGLAPAAIANGKYGYIDKNGLYEIAPAFDSAEVFSDGLARVEKDAKAFFIDKSGKAVTFANDAVYSPVGNFYNGVAWVTDAEGAYRLMRADGSFANETSYIWAADFSDGVCWASPVSGDDFLDFDMELLDTNGNCLIEQGQYTSASAFSDGVAWAKRTTDDTLVLINKQGEVLFAAPDTEGIPTPYTNGLSVGLENNLFTVRNADGTVIFSSLNYRAISYGGFSEGCMLVQDTRNSKYYIMQDNFYTKTETEKAEYTFAYVPEASGNEAFEIALYIGAPTAIVNGEKCYIDPDNHNICTFTQNGRTLVPMRFLSENLPGWSITWDMLSESALLKNDFLAASFKSGISELSYVQYNPEKRQYDYPVKVLDQPPIITEGRMFLPVRALSEIMGVNVFYDERGLVVFSNSRNTLTHEDASTYLAQF